MIDVDKANHELELELKLMGYSHTFDLEKNYKDGFLNMIDWWYNYLPINTLKTLKIKKIKLNIPHLYEGGKPQTTLVNGLNKFCASHDIIIEFNKIYDWDIFELLYGLRRLSLTYDQIFEIPLYAMKYLSNLELLLVDNSESSIEDIAEIFRKLSLK